MYLVTKSGEHIPVNNYNCMCDLSEIMTGGKWLANRNKYAQRVHWFEKPMFIDTETSHIEESDGWVHQWAICWNWHFITGRTAQELIIFLCRVSELAKGKGKNWRILGYIHNLSYDMEYLRLFFPDKQPDLFAVKARRILTARYDNVELRCSYLLTMKSLDKWSKDSATVYGKLSGGYDYDKVRTPDTPVTADEWAYQLNDVAAMADSWENDRKHDGYTVLDVPLTSTGFVRADCRAASKTDYHWKRKLDAMQPEIELYNAMEQAFQGGYTHGNRFAKNTTVRGVIGHRDFCSSYPARQMLNNFPVGKFTKFTPKRGNEGVEEIYRNSQHSCMLLHFMLENPELKHRNITAPYLSSSKVEQINKCHFLLDNGRIVKCTGVVSVWCTELDFFLIRRQYTFNMDWLECYIAPKGKLPKWFRGKIMEYFTAKNTLKHSDPVLYMLSKGKLNGIYGMTAMKCIREIIKLQDNEWVTESLSPEEREKALLKYYKKDTTFLPFIFGVYTTAWARYALFECIELVGYENFLYCDTDSIFYLSTPEIEQKLNEYNEHIKEKCRVNNAFVGSAYLGEFTPEEDSPLRAFRFVHAKCYATEDSSGKLSVTIAGVTKRYRPGTERDAAKYHGVRNKRKKKPNTKKSVLYLAQHKDFYCVRNSNADELGCIDNLTPGFIFRECGGTRIVYQKNPCLHNITVDGVQILCGASAIICDTEYKITDTDCFDSDEEAMLELLSGKYISDIYGNFSTDIK